jgi:type VI secretion system protein ImpM
LQPPGWHGKLPSLGDFASRRLEPDFIEVWDGWLAAGLLALRESDPSDWLDAYLASPSWRFLLTPGALGGPAGAQGWAGVLMPSVDRVGRYFPLTLALPLGAGPVSGPGMQALWQWLARLDELARDALHEDWDAERLEAELARMALPDVADDRSAAADAPPLRLLEVPDGPEASALIDAQAQHAWATRWRACSWWQAVPDTGTRRLLVASGLPAAAEFGHLFGRAPAPAAASGATMTAASETPAP